MDCAQKPLRLSGKVLITEVVAEVVGGPMYMVCSSELCNKLQEMGEQIERGPGA